MKVESTNAQGNLKLIAQIQSVQGIEINNKNMRPKPHVKIIVSKMELKDGDIDLIYKLLYGQNYFEWELVQVA